jgi:RNA recognition motif. (a.k.a. RRM, RBD, or RNP domain)
MLDGPSRASSNLQAYLDSDATSQPLYGDGHNMSSSIGGARNRAGTVAALSGPGSRKRTELELLRMGSGSQYQHGGVSQTSHQRSSSPTSGLMDAAVIEEDGDYADASAHDSRSSELLSAFRTGNANTVPSRSLWIGNLDPSVTAQDLMHAFAGYGAIESLRLLAEKVSEERMISRA